MLSCKCSNRMSVNVLIQVVRVLSCKCSNRMSVNVLIQVVRVANATYRT